jgi:hypothetical protein
MLWEKSVGERQEKEAREAEKGKSVQIRESGALRGVCAPQREKVATDIRRVP